MSEHLTRCPFPTVPSLDSLTSALPFQYPALDLAATIIFIQEFRWLAVASSGPSDKRYTLQQEGPFQQTPLQQHPQGKTNSSQLSRSVDLQPARRRARIGCLITSDLGRNPPRFVACSGFGFPPSPQPVGIRKPACLRVIYVLEAPGLFFAGSAAMFERHVRILFERRHLLARFLTVAFHPWRSIKYIIR